MTIHTTITLKRDGKTLDLQGFTFRGRWVGNAEHKAMQWAEAHPLFRCCTCIRILCEPSVGKTSSLSWILAHPPEPLPQETLEICA